MDRALSRGLAAAGAKGREVSKAEVSEEREREDLDLMLLPPWCFLAALVRLPSLASPRQASSALFPLPPREMARVSPLSDAPLLLPSPPLLVSYQHQSSIKIWDLESKSQVEDLRPDFQKTFSKRATQPYCISLAW